MQTTTHPSDTEILSQLAQRLTKRGTRPSRGIYRQLCGDRPWFRPLSPENRRDWRHLAARWLRRHVGGDWHVGGHHVGRYHHGPAIGDRRRSSEHDGQLVVDGKPALLEVIR